jgi:hypothetical protein
LAAAAGFADVAISPGRPAAQNNIGDQAMSRILFAAAFSLGLLSAGAAGAQSNSMAAANSMAPASTMAPAGTMAATNSMAPASTMAPAGGMTKSDTATKPDTMGSNAMTHNTMALTSTTNNQ